MRYRPWPIVFLALAQFLSPIVNILWNARLLDLPAASYVGLVLLPQNAINFVMLFVIPVLSALLIYVCKIWGLIGFLALQLVLFLWNVSHCVLYPGHYSIWTFLVATAANTLLVSYFLVPEVRRVYTDPRLRWWEAKPRFLFESPVRVSFGGVGVEGKTINVSTGGAFVQTSAALKSGDEVILSVRAFDHEFSVDAVVVHVQSGCYGLKYVGGDQASNKNFIKLVCATGASERTPRIHWKLSFRQWLADFRTPRKALLPYIPEEVLERAGRH